MDENTLVKVEEKLVADTVESVVVVEVVAQPETVQEAMKMAYGSAPTTPVALAPSAPKPSGGNNHRPNGNGAQQDPYAMAVGVYAKNRERLLADGALFAKELTQNPSGAVATEWGYAERYAGIAARCPFKGDHEGAIENGWLAVQSQNRAEAMLVLGIADKRICAYLLPNLRKATAMLAEARALVGAVRLAVPGWDLIEALAEQGPDLEDRAEELEAQAEALCARLCSLATEVENSGGASKRPAVVLKEVQGFNYEEVYCVVGASMVLVNDISSLGACADDQLRNVARFCKPKGGQSWDTISEMCEHLRTAQPAEMTNGHEPKTEAPAKPESKKELDPTVAQAIEDCLAGTATSGVTAKVEKTVSEEVQSAPRFEKPAPKNESKGNNKKKGNQHEGSGKPPKGMVTKGRGNSRGQDWN